MNDSAFRIIFFIVYIVLIIPKAVHAERIRDLTTVEGVRSNALLGYGLVVGLDGSGDQTMQTPFTVQSLKNMFSQLGITLPAVANMQLKNVAAVMVTAELPPFAQPGEKIDTVVSSLGNAKSLRGGTLLMTPLKGADNQVYALAQGNILISGAQAQGKGASIQKNQLNGGRINGGATVERAAPAGFEANAQLRLQLVKEDFTGAQNISDAINRIFGPVATAEDARHILVSAPVGKAEKVRFLSRIQNIQVNMGPSDAVVIINSRSGSVVMNRHVKLDQCAVAQGDLTVEISEAAKVSQPNTPFTDGKTVVTPETYVSLREQSGTLQHVKTSSDLNSVIQALNHLGATPADLMTILQSMKSAGCLKARVEIE